MMELWRMQRTLSLPSLPSSLCPGVVAPDRGPIYETNRTKLCACTKQNCIKMDLALITYNGWCAIKPNHFISRTIRFYLKGRKTAKFIRQQSYFMNEASDAVSNDKSELISRLYEEVDMSTPYKDDLTVKNTAYSWHASFWRITFHMINLSMAGKIVLIETVLIKIEDVASKKLRFQIPSTLMINEFHMQLE